MSNILADFFEPYDVAGLRARVLEAEGVDIQAVYCQATGKVIGTFDSSEILYAIDEIGGDDEESLIDDLLVRVVGSMRPSPAMNKPDRYTIREMVNNRPVDAFAYLANRLHGSRDMLARTSIEQHFQGLINRIALHRQWKLLEDDGLDLSPWIHWLLELDAKRNLHDVKTPFIGVDGKNNLTLAASGTPLLRMVTCENAGALLKLFESWAFELLAEYDRRDSELLRESQWVRGNSFTKAAFVQSWMGHPEIANRKLQAEYDAKQKAKAKAGRPAKSPRTQKLNAETNEFLHLLEGILDGTLEVDTPTPTPTPRLITGGMLKLNLAGRKGA